MGHHFQKKGNQGMERLLLLLFQLLLLLFLHYPKGGTDRLMIREAAVEATEKESITVSNKISNKFNIWGP